MSVITIVLADDHPIVRQGLRAVLEAEADFRVLGEASDGLMALAAVERLKPKVLVLDLLMPHLNGIAVLRQVARHFSATHVVILSMHHDESYVHQAFQHGAVAYVLKDASADELVCAVRAAACGGRYLSAPLSERALEIYAQKNQNTPPDPFETLTDREQEVLHLGAEGCSSADIAERLFISPRTVETHRANLMHKLGLQSQTDLVRYALRRGIISLDS